MVLVRRRYYLWLFKAYVKRWKKTILSSLLLGAVVFFLFFLGLSYYVLPLFNNDFEKIGYSGSYTLETLPPEVLASISYGLTKVDESGVVSPAAASSWKASDNGKVYTFTLKNDLKLSNGKPFDIKNVPYTFKDVQKEIMGPNQIRFTLKTPYAPFLSTVSAPIIVKNYGFKDYHISKVEENSGFIKSLTLTSSNGRKKKIISFYPTEDALKTAFMLGEVREIKTSSQEDPKIKLGDWKTVDTKRSVDYDTLTTVFFNTTDKTLGNKKLRQALVYGLPKTFPEGERTFSFVPPRSQFYSKSPNEGVLDVGLSKSLLDASGEKNVQITLSTSEELYPVAYEIASSWKKIGVKTTIQTTNDIPSNYQALIYTMKLPKDPDMYTIWHSAQVNNITHYKNVRIDKLLEEGRQTVDSTNRIEIYADVQKYLLDDAPAAFLYFPYTYTIRRK